jgi:hypothetical protein
MQKRVLSNSVLRLAHLILSKLFAGSIHEPHNQNMPDMPIKLCLLRNQLADKSTGVLDLQRG